MSVLVHRSLGWLRRTVALPGTRQGWAELGGLVALLGGAFLLTYAGGSLSWAGNLVLWAAWLLLAAVLVGSGQQKWVGPLLFYDLVRSARRQKFFHALRGYLVFLLVLLCWVFVVAEHSPQLGSRGQANFANRFFNWFLIAQFATVVLLTPGYVAGAIADEKDRRTLEFLLTTDLRDNEIVLSKLLARLCSLTLLILGGLPILSLTQFLGGIEPNLVLAGFTATLLTMLSLGGVSMLCSVYARKARDAIVLTYLLVAAYLAGSWAALEIPVPVQNQPIPGTGLAVEDLVALVNAGNVVTSLASLNRSLRGGAGISRDLPTLLRHYAIFHGLVAAVATAAAILRVRPCALAQGYEPAVRGASWGLPRLRPRLGLSPLWWKEVFADPGPRYSWFGFAVFTLLVALSFAPAGFILHTYWDETSYGAPPQPAGGASYDPWNHLGESMNLWVRIAGTIVAFLMLLAVAVRAAGSVSGERDRQTLDGLLASPLEGKNILFNKWAGSILSVRWAWLWLGAVWGLGVATGGLSPFFIPLMVLAWGVYAAAAAAVGLWYSVTSPTTLRATLGTLGAVLGLTAGHWLLWLCCLPIFFTTGGGGPGKAAEVVFKFQMGLTPPLVLGGVLPFRELDLLRMSDGHFLEELYLYAALGMVLWVLVPLVLGPVTYQHFQVLTGRKPPPPGQRVPPPARRGEMESIKSR